MFICWDFLLELPSRNSIQSFQTELDPNNVDIPGRQDYAYLCVPVGTILGLISLCNKAALSTDPSVCPKLLIILRKNVFKDIGCLLMSNPACTSHVYIPWIFCFSV